MIPAFPVLRGVVNDPGGDLDLAGGVVALEVGCQDGGQ